MQTPAKCLHNLKCNNERWLIVGNVFSLEWLNAIVPSCGVLSFEKKLFVNFGNTLQNIKV